MVSRTFHTVFFLLTVSLLYTFPIKSHANPYRCENLFIYRLTITTLHKNYVYRVQYKDQDVVYKIYSGADGHSIFSELNSLRFASELFKKSIPNSFLKIVKAMRATKKNEFGVFGLYMSTKNQLGPYDPTPHENNRTMLVTPYQKGLSIQDWLMNPKVSVKEKQNLMEKILAEFSKVINWIQQHPNYRHKGHKIAVKEETDGIYEFPSSDGVFEMEYRNYLFQYPKGETGLLFAFDSLSNLILAEDGRVILFDPY